MNSTKNITDNLKQIVKKSGLKQYVVAEKCGYSPKTFSDMLNNRKIITAQDIYMLCEGLDISPNDLLGGWEDGTGKTKRCEY